MKKPFPEISAKMREKLRFMIRGWRFVPLLLLLASCATAPEEAVSPPPAVSPADAVTAPPSPGPEEPGNVPGELPPPEEADEEAEEAYELPEVPLLPPGEHMRTARQLIEEAQGIRKTNSRIPSMGGVFTSFGDTYLYRGIYGEAHAHLYSVLQNHPDSREAAEAQYLLGVTNDHPHLSDFARAMEAYRETVAKYPKTKAAEKAAARMSELEDIIGTGSGGP